MQKKKLGAILLALTMFLSLTACRSGQTTQSTVAASTAKEPPTSASEPAESATEQAADSAAEDTLILYFSADNTRDADAVSSATPMTEGTSSVAWMANLIHDAVGGDLVKIVPSEDYPLDYDAVADAAKKEADADARPAFEPLGVDPTSYKTVFIGYPIWWYTVPMVVETFFDTYDLSGVTIIPFNTHAGSGDGGTYTLIQEREPDATVLDGLAVSGSSAGTDEAKDTVTQWLQELDLE